MPSGTRQSNTTDEQLRRLLPMISEMKLADDVDPEFVTQLETQVISKIREPLDRANAMSQAAQQMGAAGSPMGPMGAAAGPAPAPPATEAQGMPIEMLAQLLAAQQQAGRAAPQRGLQPSPAMPPPDELRRVLTPG
jgi:hypothetical protein